jgi:hypothetical protein
MLRRRRGVGCAPKRSSVHEVVLDCLLDRTSIAVLDDDDDEAAMRSTGLDHMAHRTVVFVSGARPRCPDPHKRPLWQRWGPLKVDVPRKVQAVATRACQRPPAAARRCRLLRGASVRSTACERRFLNL